MAALQLILFRETRPTFDLLQSELTYSEFCVRHRNMRPYRWELSRLTVRLRCEKPWSRFPIQIAHSYSLVDARLSDHHSNFRSDKSCLQLWSAEAVSLPHDTSLEWLRYGEPP
jgi:hypothetical protein